MGEEKGLVMVKDNDIYYKPLSGTEIVERLTHDGVSGVIYNGVTDRIYKGRNSYPFTSGEKWNFRQYSPFKFCTMVV